MVAQELNERGSQGVGGGRGGFGNEGGGVVDEPAGVETLVVVSRDRDASWELNSPLLGRSLSVQSRWRPTPVAESRFLNPDRLH